MAPIIAALPSIFQAGYGVVQSVQAAQGLKNLKRPEYEMPGEVKAGLALSSQAYADPYSVGELRARQDIGLSGANAAAAARDAGSGAGMAPAIQAQQSNSYNQLQVQADQQREQRRMALQQSLATVAGYRDQEWQMNKFAPYADKYAELRQMHGAGAQNIFGGMNGLAAIGSQFAANQPASTVTPTAAAQATSANTNATGSIQGVFGAVARGMYGIQNQAVQSGQVPPNLLQIMAGRPYILPY